MYPRAVTADELYLLRSSGQFSTIRAVFFPQIEVFRAEVAIPYNPVDGATTAVNYYNVAAGDYTKVVDGMTMYVYSSAGDYIGMVRAKFATPSQIIFGRSSDIAWATGQIISVVDDFGLWPRLPYLPNEETILMDDDVAYTNQNVYMKPFPIMGSDKVSPLTSGSILLNGLDSYTVDGTSISSYSWSVYNTTAGSQAATSTSGSFVFNYTTPGLYRIGLTVTSSGSVAATGYRALYVYDEDAYKPKDQITLNNMAGSVSDGGWKASLEVWDGVSGSQIRDRSKVALIARDFYGGSAASIGQIAGQENVLMIGWVDGDTIKYDADKSSIKFDLQGGRYWIEKLPQPSTSLATISSEVDDTEEDTNNWLFFPRLTINQVVHHFCTWRSTIASIMDVFTSDQNITVPGITAGIGNIWSQMSASVVDRMLMKMAVDRYNRFYIYQDPNLRLTTDRSVIPTIMDFTDDDYADEVQIKHMVTTPVAMVVVSALIGTQTDVIAMSRAPGSLVYKRFGEQKTYDRCVVDSQNTANSLSGNLLAKHNNEFPDISFTLGSNNRMFDIAPAMFARMSVSAAKNVRGISFTNKNVLVKEIEYKIDPDKGSLIVDMSVEAETWGSPGVTVTMPQEPVYNFPVQPVPIDIPIIPIPNIPPAPVPPSYIPRLPTSGSVSGSAAGIWYDTHINPGVYYTNDGTRTLIPFKCTLQPNTQYQLYGMFQKVGAIATSGSGYKKATFSYSNDDAFYNVYGVNASGSRIVTFTHNSVSGSGASGSGTSGSSIRTGYYSGSVAKDIEYLEVGMVLESPIKATDIAASYSYNNNTPTFVWGHTETGLWAKVSNFRIKMSPNQLCYIELNVSGSGGTLYNDRGLRFRWTTKKYSCNSSYVPSGYPLHADTDTGYGANTYPADPFRETDNNTNNWNHYWVNMNDALSYRLVGRDRRTTGITASGSTAVPILDYWDNYNLRLTGSGTLKLTYYFSLMKDTYAKMDEWYVIIEPIPQHRLIVGSLQVANITATPATNTQSSAIDVGSG